MNKEISNMIEDGYKILKFQRDVDLLTNEEYASIDVKALDGYVKTLTISDNEADEIEKVMFKCLEEKTRDLS